MTLFDLQNFLFERFPKNLQSDWDNCGVQIGRLHRSYTRLLIALDIDESVINEAISLSCGLILTHHPLILNPLQSITDTGTPLLYRLMENDIGVISMHTNFDAAPGGVADCLASLIGLVDTAPFGMEENGAAFGRLGSIEPKSPAELTAFVKNTLKTGSVRAYFAGRPCSLLAVMPGSGGSYVEEAAAAGADALICGDCKYHHFRTAAQLGLTLIDAGHFYTELPALSVLKAQIEEQFPDADIFLSNQTDAYKNY